MILLMFTFVVQHHSRRTGTVQRKVEQRTRRLLSAPRRVRNVMVAELLANRHGGRRAETTGRAGAGGAIPGVARLGLVAVANRAASTLTIIAIFAFGVQLHGKGEISVGEVVLRRLRPDDDRAPEQLAGFISELFFQAPGLANFFRFDTSSGLHGSERSRSAQRRAK
jgi:ATP-binding cassette subfamily B protein